MQATEPPGAQSLKLSRVRRVPAAANAVMDYPLLMSSNLQYRSRAVRAMVLFVHAWRLALASSVSLPPADDPTYESLGALGRHVLSAGQAAT